MNRARLISTANFVSRPTGLFPLSCRVLSRRRAAMTDKTQLNLAAELFWHAACYLQIVSEGQRVGEPFPATCGRKGHPGGGVGDPTAVLSLGKLERTGRSRRRGRGPAPGVFPKKRRRACRNELIDRGIGHRRPSVTRCPRGGSHRGPPSGAAEAAMCADAPRIQCAAGRRSGGSG